MKKTFTQAVTYQPGADKLPIRKALLTWFLVCAGFWALAQVPAGDLSSFNTWRLDRQKTGMLILGGWAVGNMAVGAALTSRQTGSAKYFHQMNLAWNSVNLGIAALGYWGASKSDPAAMDLFQSIQEHHKIQKILLFNAGLDVAYLMGGAYLIERSKRTEKIPERLKGFGQSILLQGGFLLVFDIAQYAALATGNEKLKPFLSAIYPTGNGIGWTLTF
jgi:hypothetical protein